MIIALAGKSPLKWEAVRRAQALLAARVERVSATDFIHPTYLEFYTKISNATLFSEDVDSIVPEQPYGLEETTRGAEHRATEVERIHRSKNPSGEQLDEIFVGIENGVWECIHSPDPNLCRYPDAAVVAARYLGYTYYSLSEGIIFPTKYVIEAKAKGTGNEVTVGKVIGKHLKCDHANPHSRLTRGLLDRTDILARAVLAAFVQIDPVQANLDYLQRVHSAKMA